MSAHVVSPTLSGDGEWTSNKGIAASPSLGGNSGRSDFQGDIVSSQPLQAGRTSLKLPRSINIQHAKDKDAKVSTKSPSSPPNVGLDPLSTQIYLRTNSNTEPTIAQRLLNSGRPESPTPDSFHRQTPDSSHMPSNGSLDSSKDRSRKGSSFLSRLAMRGNWRRDDDMHDSDSELGEMRTDGSHARALTSVIGASGGFIPLHKEPPRYIRVRPHNKKQRNFNRLFLAQELCGSKPSTEDDAQYRAPATAVGTKILKGGQAIWAAEFSLDGRYLAVAGKDQTVRVFAVLSTAEERQEHEDEEEEPQDRCRTERLSAPVFQSKPVRVFEGHKGEVLALSWSKNNFLLSSSMDKTVKLWHMSRTECLCTFAHNDLVTSIAFHPTDDRFFLAGSLDAQLRLWSIPDKSVAFAAPTNEFITAVAFSPDGKVAICGLLSGHCMFYITEGLKLQSQIHVRSSRGKNAKGSKITGIRTATIPPETGDVKVLISSNDSRVRVYSLKTKMLEVKFKGLENQSSQIHARFCDDTPYVISGSEDRKAYIWDLSHPEAEIRDKQPFESFDAHPEVVTTALMAPTKSKLLLSGSGDPIYDLCNPPPVTLLSLDEKSASQTKLSERDDAHTLFSSLKKADESPAYLERAKHLNGNIIITTDRTGTIKVFRQDCASVKRHQSLWDSNSKLSQKLNGVARSSSIITRTSAGSKVNSRRESLNITPSTSTTQPTLDRIMSWRDDVDEGRTSTTTVSSRKDRSMSPSKASRSSVNTSAANLASAARKPPYAASPVARSHKATSPTSSTHTSRLSIRYDRDREQGLRQPPTPSFSLISASDSDHQEEKEEGSFWNLNRWKGSLSSLRHSTTAGSLGGSGPTNTPTRHSRHGSQPPPTTNRTNARRSMGAGELSKLTAKETASRRRSMGPTLPSAVPAAPSRESSADSRRNSVVLLATTKKRTDSGVAQLSAESTDNSDDASCHKCGSSRTRPAIGRSSSECAKCGAPVGN